MIKIDPSQTKTVIVLLLILAAAVVVTVLRIHPSTRPATTATATEASVQINPEARSIAAVNQTERNPFRMPNAMRGTKINRSSLISGRGVNEIRHLGSMKLEPMPIAAATPVASNKPVPAQTDKIESPKPKFELLATVGGPKGLCGVIRTGESSTKIVSVGDILECGYRVKKLDENCAVLTDGSDIIVAKRPVRE